jgi:hypothetical protein
MLHAGKVSLCESLWRLQHLPGLANFECSRTLGSGSIARTVDDIARFVHECGTRFQDSRIDLDLWELPYLSWGELYIGRWSEIGWRG